VVFLLFSGSVIRCASAVYVLGLYPISGEFFFSYGVYGPNAALSCRGAQGKKGENREELETGAEEDDKEERRWRKINVIASCTDDVMGKGRGIRDM